ncbi:pyruvate kinase [Candidatus Falkowbacteria bacterium]|nr:pyruvate kinase [Candidatus Falkowbacteria bacterium]
MQTKIITTIGPKSEAPEVIKKMVEAGVDMFRFNFSHTTTEQFLRVSKLIRKISKELGKDIKIIQDLQGPRIRVGKLPAEGVMLADGQEIGFTVGQNDLPNNLINIDDKKLYEDIRRGDPLFLSNGSIELVVLAVKGDVIWCRVIQGGLLTSSKGVNVPGTNLKRGGLTEKDIADVKFALKTKQVDYVALSFVQEAEDVSKLRGIIRKEAGEKNKIKIISKIERGVALKDIDRIIVESDVIMFARGDLGIEVPVENLPIIQKNIVRHAHWHNTPVIIATQVLTSMIISQNPTRAEVSDISNAIFDRGDAVMLSDETAVGAHPIEAVKILKKVIKRTEEYLEKKNFFDPEIQRGTVNKYSNLNVG